MKTVKLMAIVRKTVEVEEATPEVIAKLTKEFDDEPVGSRAFHYFPAEVN